MQLEVIPWNEDGPPREAELTGRLAADGFTAMTWSDGPGAEYAPHDHPHDESLWVLRGEITFGVGGREYALGPGDRLMLPAGTTHTAVAGSGGATYLIGRRELG